MEERTNWVVHVAGVDVERSLIRPKRQRLLTVQTAISSWTAYDVEGWPIADDVCIPMNRIGASGYASCRAINVQVQRTLAWIRSRREIERAVDIRICIVLPKLIIGGAQNLRLAWRRRLRVIWGEWGKSLSATLLFSLP
jgi:hypothetical protein